MAGYRRQLYRDDAVVLRVQKLGESDRIITLLTRRHGRLRAVARGVRRTTSKFGARLEPFGHVDLQLAGDPKGNHGSSLHTVSQVEGIDLYGKRFLGDYPRYTAASAIAETAERLTPVEREPSLRLFQLTLGALQGAGPGRARHHPGARRVPAARDGPGRLGAGADRLRGLRHARAAPGVLRTGRGRGLPGLPAARRGPSRAGHHRSDVRADHRRLGDRRRHRRPAYAGSAAAWSRRTCSGTWSARYARCRWSTGVPRRPARPRRRRAPGPWCSGHVATSRPGRTARTGR